MARRGRKKKQGGVWKRVLVWGAGGLLVVLVVGYFGVTAWVRSYLHGEGFRRMVGDKVSVLLKAEGEFGAFRWDEAVADVDGFSAKGYEDAAFSELTVDGLKVDVNLEAARDKVWEVRRVDVRRAGVIITDDGRLAGTAPEVEAGTAGAEGEGGLFRSFLPDRVEVKAIEVGEANVRLARGDAGEVRAEKMRVSVRPEGEGRAAVTVDGGTLTAAGMPEVELESGSGRVTPERIYVTEVSGTFMDGADLRAEGTVERTSPPEVALAVEFDELEAEKVLPEDWKRRLTGTLRGTVDVAGKGGAEGYGERGEVFLEKGVLEALPVLDKIADYTRTDNFRRLVLNEAWMRFERRGGLFQAREILLESAGLLRVEGSLTVQNGEAEGLFQVGVTPGTLRWIPSAESKVFTREERGYRWTTVKVWGRTDDLQQDLGGRLAVAAVEGTAEAAVDAATSLLPGAAKEGTRGAADGVIETGGELIRQGTGLLRGLLPFGN